MKKDDISRRFIHSPTKAEMDGFMDALEKAWNRKADLSFCRLVGAAISGEGSRFYKRDVEAIMDMEAVYKRGEYTSIIELETEFGFPKDTIAKRRTKEQIAKFLKLVRKMWKKNSRLSFVDLVNDAVMGRAYKSYLKDSELMEKLRRI